MICPCSGRLSEQSRRSRNTNKCKKWDGNHLWDLRFNPGPLKTKPWSPRLRENLLIKLILTIVHKNRTPDCSSSSGRRRSSSSSSALIPRTTSRRLSDGTRTPQGPNSRLHPGRLDLQNVFVYFQLLRWGSVRFLDISEMKQNLGRLNGHKFPQIYLKVLWVSVEVHSSLWR